MFLLQIPYHREGRTFTVVIIYDYFTKSTMAHKKKAPHCEAGRGMEFCTRIELMNDAFQGTHVATPSTELDYPTNVIISIDIKKKNP
jgi:hypothetical protein